MSVVRLSAWPLFVTAVALVAFFWFPSRWVPGALELASPYYGRAVGGLVFDNIDEDLSYYKHNDPDDYQHYRWVMRQIWLRYLAIWGVIGAVGYLPILRLIRRFGDWVAAALVTVAILLSPVAAFAGFIFLAHMTL
ncbi:MAG: hypothetical protein QJR03_09130 [Sphaerobacter sp.]|nr:hypothetical protein [Sphaerobacter sp.]